MKTPAQFLHYFAHNVCGREWSKHGPKNLKSKCPSCGASVNAYDSKALQTQPVRVSKHEG